MLAVRIIPCLDVDNGRVVKGVRFKRMRDAGDPVELARLYDRQGADEILFLDIGAACSRRRTMVDVVEKISRWVFVPLTVGGGISSVEDMRAVLNAGADKISICSAALDTPELITAGAEVFGSQCVVVSIDAKRDGGSWRCRIKGGRVNTGMDAVTWAKRAESLGAGEILLNSIDRDGTRSGYDLELIRRISGAVSIPVIASGGAGSLDQILAAIQKGKADAVLAASVLHAGSFTVPQIKEHLKEKGVNVR